MANPQKENGFTPISNEILEKLYGSGLSGSELAMCLMVIRKTYGFSKKEDWISLSQFERELGYSRRQICKTKRKLVNSSILAERGNKLKFNKNYDHWVGNSGSPLVNSSSLGRELQFPRVVNSSSPTKETITKENIQKELLKLKTHLKDKKIIKRLCKSTSSSNN